MIPASFAKTILKLILPNVTEHLMKVFKLDKVLSYVEKPNDADKKIEILEISDAAKEVKIEYQTELIKEQGEQIETLTEEIKVMKKELNKLK